MTLLHNKKHFKNNSLQLHSLTLFGLIAKGALRVGNAYMNAELM